MFRILCGIIQRNYELLFDDEDELDPQQLAQLNATLTRMEGRIGQICTKLGIEEIPAGSGEKDQAKSFQAQASQTDPIDSSSSSQPGALYYAYKQSISQHENAPQQKSSEQEESKVPSSREYQIPKLVPLKKKSIIAQEHHHSVPFQRYLIKDSNPRGSVMQIQNAELLIEDECEEEAKIAERNEGEEQASQAPFSRVKVPPGTVPKLNPRSNYIKSMNLQNKR